MNRNAKRTTHITWIALLALAGAGMGAIWPRVRAKDQRPPAAPPRTMAKKVALEESASLQRHRNLGKGYYEQAKYPEAISEFRAVVASRKALATDHFDLGLALMQANDLDAALGELTTAKQMDSKLVAADYNLGILYKRELRYPDAEATLRRVIDTDPQDAAAWFNLGTVYFAQKKLEPALDAHRHVVDMGFGRGQNFYVASLFHTFTILVRLKRQDEAQKVLKIHERMRDKVPNISLQSPALEAGKYGAVLVQPASPAAPPQRLGLERVVFDEMTSKLGIALPAVNPPAAQPDALRAIKSSEYSLEFARRDLVPLFGGSIASGDYDGDGRPDLYVVVPGGTNHLLRNNGDGTFTDLTSKAGVAGPGSSLSAAFADYDNSGHMSLFVAGLGGVKLFRYKGDGVFADETEKAGFKSAPGELLTRAVLFDADNDGFLDLVATAYTDLSAPPQKESFAFPEDFSGGGVRFYRNNGEGTFTDATASSGLGSARGRIRQCLFADFDGDGYADLLLLRDDGPPLLYINRGEGRFADHTAEAGEALAKSGAVEAQVADFNHDGNFDLAVWSPSGYQVLMNHGNASFVAAENLPALPPPGNFFARRGAVVDVNGDGFDDLLVNSGGRWHLIANQAGKFREAPLSFLPKAWPSSEPGASGAEELTRIIASLTPAWLGDAGRLDLLALQPNGQVAVFEKQGPPSHWMEVKLNGFKSNMQGIGTIVEFKAGNFYSKVQATGSPVRVFTGGLTKLDVVRVTWPNQIVQNSLEVATNKRLEVRESERLASSCPLLYVWDGRRFVFLTDVLGVAPLGELAPDGTRIKPYPEEFVRLPAKLALLNGSYVFQITDELREVDYVDQLRLVAVDHPATEEIYSNEIFSSSPISPRLYAVRGKRCPLSAVDEHGHEVLPLVREADGRYPADFHRDRILGMADLHSLTLDLGEVPDSSPAALWLKGWVFWTDSNASRALMSNPSLKMVPPYLQVRDRQGSWVTVIPDMGLPSGTNRTMRVDLTGKFLSGDHHVRIVTNLCVYWDQVFFTTDDAPLEAASRLVELPLEKADLHYRGFSRPASDPQHLRPDAFDYAHVLADAPWNPMRGRYTRYGPVIELLHEADDRLAVMATGDELTVKFSGRRLPPLNPRWQRSFFLYLNGWAKDGEPNTAFAGTVAPLPFRSMANYPPETPRRPESSKHRRYLREYQTRPGYLLIPPLAPQVE